MARHIVTTSGAWKAACQSDLVRCFECFHSFDMKMRDDFEFNVRFVELVESKPCLYDYNRPDYCNRTAQDAAWNEISKTIKETVNDCKDRWKNIRGSFTKYLNKKVPSGSSAKPIKPYYLAENLHFLQPFTKSRKSLGNTKMIQEESIANEIDSSKSDSELEAPLSDTNEYGEKSSSEAVHVPKKKKETKKYPTLQEVNSSAFEYFQKKQTKLQECPEKTEDPDRAFLISMLPDMKKMTDFQKRKFKIGILNLAGEILEENQISNSNVQQMISPLSESSSNPSNIQVYSPVNITTSNQPANENRSRTYHTLQTLHGTDFEYTTSFSNQQPQGYSYD